MLYASSLLVYDFAAVVVLVSSVMLLYMHAGSQGAEHRCSELYFCSGMELQLWNHPLWASGLSVRWSGCVGLTFAGCQVPPSHYTSTGQEGDNKTENLVWDKDREITHQLLSGTKQTQHVENEFNLLPIKISLESETETKRPSSPDPFAQFHHSPSFPTPSPPLCKPHRWMRMRNWACGQFTTAPLCHSFILR